MHFNVFLYHYTLFSFPDSYGSGRGGQLTPMTPPGSTPVIIPTNSIALPQLPVYVLYKATPISLPVGACQKINVVEKMLLSWNICDYE